MRSIKNKITIFLVVVLASQRIETANANGRTGKIQHITKPVSSKQFSNLYIVRGQHYFNVYSFQNTVVPWRMFTNPLWIELPKDRGHISTKNLMTRGSMLRLIRASINENAKTRPFTRYDVGESQNLPSLDTDNLGLRMKKRSPCIYTGVIQVICRLWQLMEKKGRTVSSGQPMLRPLDRFGRNWTEMMDATFFAAKGRKKK